MQERCLRWLVAACLCGISGTSARGEDWPGWRGKDRSDISRETDLMESWPEGGPPRLWMFPDAGLGYSGPALADGKVFLMGARKKVEFLIALDAKDGKELWKLEMGERFDNRWGNGPRGTPTVDGDRVYALSGMGDVVCAEAATGKLIWKARLQDFGGEPPYWGYSESVLVDDKHLACTPGGNRGAILALDKMTGRPVWQSEDLDDGAHYSSIVPFSLGDSRQYVQLLPERLVGLDVATGRRLWESAWNGRIAVIPTPIVHNREIYVTSGYGVGCMKVSIEPDGATGEFRVQEDYRSKLMKNHHGGVVLVDGYLYGYSDGVGWLCQRLDTGDEVWREREALEKGALTYADGKLYCLGENTGTVVLIDASPEGWREHGRFTLAPQTTHRKPDGRIWTHPVVSHGRLYLRDQELFFCFDIREKK